MTDIPSGSIIAHGDFTSGAISLPPQYLTIGSFVRISLDDGSIEYGADYQPDEAARTFWEAMSSTYSDAVAANKRIRAYLEDMAGWCSPHGVAADYAQRGLDALDGKDPLGASEERPTLTPEQLARLATNGIDTAGCDCGHEGMGISWHARDCVWRLEQR
ncbi:MAG TPA: hypothetical protein VF760_04170 [Xanthobacteraceae bacterium]